MTGLSNAIPGHAVTALQCDACNACEHGRETGICPLLSCPKQMLNGPCGGMRDGMCEVGDRPCIHVTIRRRLIQKGAALPGIIPALDHSVTDAFDRGSGDAR